MPVLWRLLLSWYLKLFALGTASLLCLLMATRLHDIASLAALGMSWKPLSYYTLYQIPSVLPIAISFSAFLAPLLMGHFLFKSHELISLSACRLRLREFVYPLIVGAFLLSALNFYVVSEIAPQCHLKARQMVLELQRTSPLALLKQPHLVDKGHFAAFSQGTKEGLSQDFVFVFYQARQGRLGLIKAQEIGLEEGLIFARKTLLMGSKKGKEGDSLWMENIGETRANGDLFSWIGSGQRKLSPDHLSLETLASAYQEASPKLKKQYTSELGRRLAFTLSPLSFSLLAALYAFTHEKKKKVLLPAFLVLVSLALIFVSKNVFTKPLLAWTLQLAPPLSLLIFSLSLVLLKEKGKLA